MFAVPKIFMTVSDVVFLHTAHSLYANIQGYQIPYLLHCNKSLKVFGETGGDSLSYFSLLTFNFHRQMPKTVKITRGAKRSNTASTSVANEIPTQQIQQLHNQNRESLIRGLYNRSIQQLIHDFIIEMDAKNKAYYFILESGLFNEFSNYCKKK
ncbi:hypothetical protein ACILD6_00155 [Capnocytophaga canimorsus]|uniref:hypothetical protein n=2 Tax=Capnocytophaga canimorsus TaxID=28188 RepID=UPI0037D3C5EB